jgi:hypothetical protein
MMKFRGFIKISREEAQEVAKRVKVGESLVIKLISKEMVCEYRKERKWSAYPWVEKWRKGKESGERYADTGEVWWDMWFKWCGAAGEIWLKEDGSKIVFIFPGANVSKRRLSLLLR